MKKFLGRKKTPNPSADENPYAQEPANDPYAYQQSSNEKVLVSHPGGLPSGPRGGRPGGVGLPGGPAPRGPSSSASSMSGPSPSYNQQAPPPQQSSGYGNDRYGAAGGYGSSNRYGDSNPYGGGGGARGGQNDGPAAGGRRPGGYGGLSRDADDGAGRDALFGGAKDRVQNAPPGRAPNGGGYGAGGYGASQAPQGGYGGAPSDGPTGNKYGGYGEERELTEQEQIKLEEREMARQIDQERDATVDTGHRILGIINSTIETANGTLQNMAQQDERLRNTERNLDLAEIHNRTAQEKTKELKHYNRSLWNPGNPFMTKSKKEQRERKFMEDQEKDRERREKTLLDAHQSQAKYDRDMREIQDSMNNRRALGLSSTQAAASNNKFVFDESDDEDDNPENMALRADRRAKEDEINNVIMPGMEQGVATLNQIARTFGQRVEESNKLIDRIGDKSDNVDMGVRNNRRKLDDILR